MSYKFIASLVLGTLVASPLMAAHANPWMEEGDTVLMQYHDENLELDAGEDDGDGDMNGYAGGGAQGGGSGH